MLGLRKGTVRLMPHVEVWHQLFAQEEARLRDAIGEQVVAIEHVGSTAICGLSAKPVIDIAVAVREISDAEKCVMPLENIGYEYRGEYGIPGRHYFIKGEPRTHHVHMVELSGNFWRTHLLFRDYLRRCPEVAKEYENLKKELAQKHAEDREAYTEGKAAFIGSVLEAAGR
ncbi:MAG: GrpB family protein [Pyrinomonadaceae bacterium]|nr:GrpB family protein [Pyrinomonadaceae bacterium]